MNNIIGTAVCTAINLDEALSASIEKYENAIECVCKVEAPKTNDLIRCPHCGESYYAEDYSETTCMYYQPIYKDGVNINPDRNTTTTHCTCMNCGKKFSYDNRGKINTVNNINDAVKTINIDFTDKDINGLFG